MLLDCIRGFCMALADSVPGVSGGTIAFILGFYDKFVSAIDDVVHGRGPQRRAGVVFLGKLGLGWIVGFGLATLVLTSVFDTHIYAVSSLFTGFIVASVPYVIYEERQSFKGALKWAPLALVGLLAVAALSLWGPTLAGDGAGLVGECNLSSVLYVFASGAIAISAMVLPGISGSTLLLILGMYLPIMQAVRGILSFDFAGLWIIVAFVGGVVVGIVAVVRFVRRAFERWRAQTLFVIIGMMLGSLVAVAQGPTTLDVPMAALSLSTLNVPFFLGGFALIVVIGMAQKILSSTKVA